MTKQKMTEDQRKDILLVAIYLFSQYGRDKEMSRSELVDCLKEVQKEFPVGYEFPGKLPYVCVDLDNDLDDLWLHKGYVKRWKYSHRGAPLFPANFVTLWPLGRGHAKKLMETISPEIIDSLHKAAVLAIKNYKMTWGLYIR